MSIGKCHPTSVNQSVGFPPVAAENRQHPSVDVKLVDSVGSDRFAIHSWPGFLRRQLILVEGETPLEFDASIARLQPAIAGRRIPMFTGMCCPASVPILRCWRFRFHRHNLTYYAISLEFAVQPKIRAYDTQPEKYRTDDTENIPHACDAITRAVHPSSPHG